MIQGFMSSVVHPSTVFWVVANVRAKTSEYFQANLEELDEMGLPPNQAAEPDTMVISTRAIMYVPAKYTALLFNSAGYSLRQVWEILLPALQAANDLVNCAALPVVKWLRVVSTRTQTNGITIVAIELKVPLVDERLISHRMRILHQLLPGLFQPQQSLELAITQMAAAVTQNTNDSQVAREKGCKSRGTQFTFRKICSYYWHPPGIPSNERNLPTLWHQWANWTK
jgi:hypothetical protein